MGICNAGYSEMVDIWEYVTFSKREGGRMRWWGRCTNNNWQRNKEQGLKMLTVLGLECREIGRTGLNYGPQFQAVEKVSCDNKKAVLR